MEEQRDRLALAYVQCLKEIPEEKISVKAVTERCGMIRQHFYKYFDDIQALIYWFHASHIISVLERHDGFQWNTCVPEILTAMQEHRDFYCISAKGASNPRLEMILYKDLYCLCLDVLDFRLDGTVPQEYELLLKLYSHGAVSILYGWFHDGMNMPADDLADLLQEGLPPKLRDLLEDPVPIQHLKDLGRDMARLGANDMKYF